MKYLKSVQIPGFISFKFFLDCIYYSLSFTEKVLVHVTE